MIAAEITAKKNINDLSDNEKMALMRNEYSAVSHFQKLFSNDHVELDCEPFYSLFRQEIQRLLLEKKLLSESFPLEELHHHLSDEMRTYNFNDGVNKISTFFYENDSTFQKLYWRFIVEYLQNKIFKQPFWFQATPTIRIHCPNAVNSNHYPRYHTDIGYGHPPQEINLWLPLTELKEGHGFRVCDLDNSRQILEEFNYNFTPFIDSAINDKSFTHYCNDRSRPITTEPGKVLLFDSRCIHTGEPLIAHTRISIDIRILPLQDYELMDIEYQGTGRRRILFTPGNGYYHLSSDQLTI